MDDGWTPIHALHVVNEHLALPQLLRSALRLFLFERQTLSHKVDAPEELGVLLKLVAPPWQS